MKIVTVIGARPQFIKAATVSRAIDKHNRRAGAPSIEEIVVHTGQHYDDNMSAVFFRQLEMPEPHYNIGTGSGPHGKQTGEMLEGIERVLFKEQPDWVLVYGDTNSTLAGALAAAKLHIPIAHVEAGLRSFNRRMPEEINRIVADQLSQLLLCPSQVAVDNLAREGISSGVVMTGDVMADALIFAEAKAKTHSVILDRLNLQPKTYLLATIHRAENTDDTKRLEAILSAFAAVDETIIFPAHPRTRKFLSHDGYQLPNNVRLIEPLGYFDTVVLEGAARMLLTDSGGMQKEAYWLKVPCITLRDETEWIETVEQRWNVLTGADRDRIVSAVQTFTTPAQHPPLYGNGKAAMGCLKALVKFSQDDRQRKDVHD